ncbi:DUF4883 family protein [Clostridium akagii]|uniref:DUF4883 family protein n=1 Tax=Clostridium akagii TaxID=91623 RepID=UPI00047CC2C4|nr:DUF4883 family protein [Clostridium akagii]
MKKKLYIFILLFFCISLTSCSNLPTFQQKKPNNFYYTELLCGDLKLNNDYKILLLDTNFYKKVTLDKAECNLIKNSTLTLRSVDFINKPNDLTMKAPYKLYFIFKNTSYVAEVYNEKYLSIYPWDGDYPRDYINMDSLPVSYNLFQFCKNIIPRD